MTLTYIDDSIRNNASFRWETITTPSLDQHICKIEAYVGRVLIKSALSSAKGDL